jgi:hypothetical protein
MLLTPQRVLDFSSSRLDPLSGWLRDRLRGDVLRLADDDGPEAATTLLDTVLERLCGFAEGPESRWQRGNLVEARFGRRSVTGEMIKPRRVWLGPRGGVLPVFVDDEPRLGLGRGRRAVSRVLEWCRSTGHSLALVTNSRQFRLLYVGAEHDAWAEADTALWFEGGEPGHQVEALRRLLQPDNFAPATEGQPAPLLDAILKSRQGQAQVTSILGERVRQAVEVLIHAHGPYLRQHPEMGLPEVYRAATMVMMRLVVLLFAESRKLLPVDNSPVYRTGYSLNAPGGLWDKLQRAAGGNTARLRLRHGAWPQMLALFKLIFEGSHHPELSIRRYGGELFRPGTADAAEPVRRVIHLLETAALHGDPLVMSDADVHEVLRLLTQTVAIIRQGNAGRAYPMPVDFSDLSTEYIGILYEGLLDYELQQAPAGDAILFLNLGDQPALPLSRLEGLDGNDLKALFKEFQKKKTLAVGGDEDDGGDEPADEPEAPESAEGGEPVLPEGEGRGEGEVDAQSLHDAPEDGADGVRQRALAWARRAVIEARLARTYTGNDPVRRADNEQRLTRAANGLLARPPILPGEHFLVRWGGTRKGQGSFYTRPGLVAPTVRRTLAPLCYELPAEPSEADLRELTTPKPPAVILALKVADIGMGSASFLVSALRFMTEALFRSLLLHRWLVETDGAFVPGPGLPAGEPSWFRECVRDLPVALEAAEATIKARLKRLVVERCIYGVDLDPLAVELGRLALWIETMDRDLPFGFLDHKIKCGNSLIGCWFDRFEEFPALCLNRPGDDAGDKTHSTAVHCEKGRLSAALKAFRDDRLKPALAHWIEAHQQVQLFTAPGQTPADLHASALTLFEEMHALPVHLTEERALFYRERIEGNPQFQQLRVAFDTWCALWFWPLDQLDHFPLPSSSRSSRREEAQTSTAAENSQSLVTSAATTEVENTFANPSPVARDIVRRLRERHHFFHWELEFPDVFSGACPSPAGAGEGGRRPGEGCQEETDSSGSGFDALLGNPPWEVQKPSSKEYFSNHDPLYRTYGKQEALRWQNELFQANEAVERDWVDYCARFKALSNWCAHTAYPWGDPVDNWTKFSLARGRANAELHAHWRARRAAHRGFADARHPFRHQGSADLNTYKLFLEQMHALVRNDGRFGVIVPSNVYTDKGSTSLRVLFLDHCRWEWLFGFENREKLFDIDSRFKFCPLIIAKGGQTQAIRTAFMRRQLADWENAERYALAYPRAQVTQFSPHARVILELRSARDATVLEKMYAHGVMLGDSTPRGWGLKYAREFDMTNDSRLFPPRPQWEAQGYIPDEYGHWLKGNWRPIAQCGVRSAESETWPTQPWRRARSILEREVGLVLSRDGARTIRVEEIEDVALPLYEGRMIDHYDFSAKGWVSGKGRAAVWRDVPWEQKVIEPQFLIALRDARHVMRLKLAFLDIGSATNARSMFAAVLDGFPCGNVAPVLTNAGKPIETLVLATVLNSFAYDFAVRLRLGGLHLNYFVVEETSLAKPSDQSTLFNALGRIALSLNFASSISAPVWESVSPPARSKRWEFLWAATEAERLRLSSTANALIASAYGLDFSDFTEVLRDCDHPRTAVGSDEFTRTLDPKGFWRVDKEKDPELRHTVLSLVAFHDLQRLGLEAFLNQNHGEGWLLPATLRLSDYGLGHDVRAREPQPVAARLGERFYSWQLEGTVEESWEECRRHAENLRRIRAVGAPAPAPAALHNAPIGAGSPTGPATDLLGVPIETDLFGNEVPRRRTRR